MKVLADRLVALRKTLGVIQTEIANLAGISHTSITQYETGLRLLDIERHRKLAVVFGVTSDYLSDYLIWLSGYPGQDDETSG